MGVWACPQRSPAAAWALHWSHQETLGLPQPSLSARLDGTLVLPPFPSSTHLLLSKADGVLSFVLRDLPGPQLCSCQGEYGVYLELFGDGQAWELV